VLRHPGEKWGKRQEENRERAGKEREAYFSTMASLFMLFSLPSKSF
jgi:hypothetical protein